MAATMHVGHWYVFRSRYLLAVMVACLANPIALGANFALTPHTTLIGEVGQRTLRYEETFASVAREEGLGWEALRRANPAVDPWMPGAQQTVRLPHSLLLPDAPREGIVVNLAELRLYYFDPAGDRVSVFPIGIGSEGRETPLMLTHTVAKIENPVWYPTPSIRARHAAEGDPLPRVVPPGPDNPLGRLAIQLARQGYLIHGTNSPVGVGRRVSSGCIRLYNDDIAALVPEVPNGTPVRVINQPFKAGWHEGVLYLEAHTEGGAYTPAVRRVLSAIGDRDTAVDWDRVTEIARAGAGLPTPVVR